MSVSFMFIVLYPTDRLRGCVNVPSGFIGIVVVYLNCISWEVIVPAISIFMSVVMLDGAVIAGYLC